jgi:hypothetical protein
MRVYGRQSLRERLGKCRERTLPVSLGCMVFERLGRSRHADGSDGERRPFELVGKIVERTCIGQNGRLNARQQARRLVRKQAEEIALQVSVAKGLLVQMNEIDRVPPPGEALVRSKVLARSRVLARRLSLHCSPSANSIPENEGAPGPAKTCFNSIPSFQPAVGKLCRTATLHDSSHYSLAISSLGIQL